MVVEAKAGAVELRLGGKLNWPNVYLKNGRPVVFLKLVQTIAAEFLNQYNRSKKRKKLF